jgi:hypothetical protein
VFGYTSLDIHSPVNFVSPPTATPDASAGLIFSAGFMSESRSLSRFSIDVRANSIWLTSIPSAMERVPSSSGRYGVFLGAGIASGLVNASVGISHMGIFSPLMSSRFAITHQ